MKNASYLKLRKFDAEASDALAKRLNLSIIFLIGDIQVSFTSNISKSREYQSLNKMFLEFRAGLHLDTGAYILYLYLYSILYASYRLRSAPQSPTPIGSEYVGMKGEISHPTLNILL